MKTHTRSETNTWQGQKTVAQNWTTKSHGDSGVEKEGTMARRNTRNYSPSDTASYPEDLNRQQCHCENLKSCTI